MLISWRRSEEEMLMPKALKEVEVSVDMYVIKKEMIALSEKGVSVYLCARWSLTCKMKCEQ